MRADIDHGICRDTRGVRDCKVGGRRDRLCYPRFRRLLGRQL
jgi:hypothetical protein